MTGTEDWRVRRWAATHRRIFTAALALFEDFGFEQVSVGQIATAASVSVPTFYAHYPSKEHLIMALPTAEQVEALLASQPGELSVGARRSAGPRRCGSPRCRRTSTRRRCCGGGSSPAPPRCDAAPRSSSARRPA
ncbi:TetR/AcrR family transcriptional regulator [Blastococcus sp. TML/M2B]|nr:TetR/AcrR family transcriptional regulator [Blastococcus sp. TML/M2B]